MRVSEIDVSLSVNITENRVVSFSVLAFVSVSHNINVWYGLHMNLVNKLIKKKCFFHDWEAAFVPIEVCRYLAMLPICPAPHIKGDEV